MPYIRFSFAAGSFLTFSGYANGAKLQLLGNESDILSFEKPSAERSVYSPLKSTAHIQVTDDVKIPGSTATVHIQTQGTKDQSTYVMQSKQPEEVIRGNKPYLESHNSYASMLLSLPDDVEEKESKDETMVRSYKGCRANLKAI